jgi:hypothetical protein
MTTESGQGANEDQSGYVGRGMQFSCPCCGEDVWMFIPRWGEIEIMAAKDILPASDEEDEEA